MFIILKVSDVFLDLSLDFDVFGVLRDIKICVWGIKKYGWFVKCLGNLCFFCLYVYKWENYFFWWFMKRMLMKMGDGDLSGILFNVFVFLVKLWKLVEDL